MLSPQRAASAQLLNGTQGSEPAPREGVFWPGCGFPLTPGQPAQRTFLRAGVSSVSGCFLCVPRTRRTYWAK